MNTPNKGNAEQAGSDCPFSANYWATEGRSHRHAREKPPLDERELVAGGTRCLFQEGANFRQRDDLV